MSLSRVTARRAIAALALVAVGLASTAALAEENDETELVTWGKGGKNAGLGLGVFAHLGLGYRHNDTPYGEPFEPAGATYGLTGLIKPNRWIAFGLGYDHIDFGQDRSDVG